MHKILSLILCLSSFQLFAQNTLNRKTNSRILLNSTTGKDLILASINYRENSKACTLDDIQIEINPESGLNVKDIEIQKKGDGSWANIKATFYASKPVYGVEVRYKVNNTLIYDHETNNYKEGWIKIKVTLTDQILLSASNNLMSPAIKDDEIVDIVSYNNHFLLKEDKSGAYKVWNYSQSNKNSFILDLGNSPNLSDFIIIDKGELTGNKEDNISKLTISLSDDKTVWQDYVVNDPSNQKHLKIEPTQARFVKLSIQDKDKVKNGYIGLFQIFGENQYINITDKIKNLKPELIDNNFEESVENWKAEKSHTHIFEFESIQTVDQIDFFEYRNVMQSIGFPPRIDLKVEVSLDKKIWKTISEQRSTYKFKRIGLTSLEKVKYIRTTTYQETKNVDPGPPTYYWALAELRVYGSEHTNQKGRSLISNENQQNQKITIFPNPASEFIIIKGGEVKNKITIFNILGKSVKTVFNYHEGDKIDIRDLKQGVYLIPLNERVYKVIVH